MKKQLSILGGLLTLSALNTNLNAQAPTFQVIHNCADAAAANVKIWANGGVLVPNIAFRNATPTGTVVAGTYTIGVSAPTATAQSQSLATFVVTFNNNTDYKIVANGIVTPIGYAPNSTAAPFTLSTFTSNVAGPSAGQTQILVNHGSTDAPTVDIVAPFTGTVPVIPNILVNNASYTNFAGWLTLGTMNYKIQVRDQFSENVVQEYSAPLQTLGLGGQRITVLASGFLDPTPNSNGPSFGLWVAAATGGSLIPLPTALTSSTRLQAIHNCADAAAASVDVWLQSATTGTASILLLNNFAFRTASPFIDAPADEVVTLFISAPTSTSSAGAIATFTYNLASNLKYQLIASGIVSPAGYSPNAATVPFRLIANGSVRERALLPANTDVLIFHGATDAPSVNVLALPSTTLASGLAYSNYNSVGYNAIATLNYSLSVNSGTTTVARYLAPLSTLGLNGTAVTVLASGFLNPANNSNGAAFGLWVAAATGGSLIPLPLITVTSTSINENNSLNSFLSVYPNPITNEVMVKNTSNENLKITLVDVTGKVILTQNSVIGVNSINTSELSNGIYFIKVSSATTSSTYKIVK